MVNFYAPAVVPQIMQPLRSSLEGKTFHFSSESDFLLIKFVLGIWNSFACLVKAAESFQPGFYVWVNLLAKI